MATGLLNRIYIHIYVCVYIYMNLYSNIYLYIHIINRYVNGMMAWYVYVYIYIGTNSNKCMYVCIYVCMYVCMYVYIYIICTCILMYIDTCPRVARHISFRPWRRGPIAIQLLHLPGHFLHGHIESLQGRELPLAISKYKECQKKIELRHVNMGVSEHSVPLNPMVNDHYPY